MRYLGFALFAEGKTDHAFLRPLLRRLAEDVCARDSLQPVEFGEVLELHSPARLREETRDARIHAAAQEARGAWHILFIHSDGGADAEGIRAKLIIPAQERLRKDLQSDEDSVAVVPVRETEAWLLCDGEALRQVFRTSLADAELGIPERILEVEKVLDPKALLQQVVEAARGGRRRKRSSSQMFLGPLAESVALSALRQVPSFQRLENDLREALQSLRFLDRVHP